MAIPLASLNYLFSVLITKEENWYVARCPELNITSSGKDVEAARATLREAIERYFETWGVPTASCVPTGTI